jgi:hypothetical protein
MRPRLALLRAFSRRKGNSFASDSLDGFSMVVPS